MRAAIVSSIAERAAKAVLCKDATLPVDLVALPAITPECARQAQGLRDQAARCRRLSGGVNDRGVIATLGKMALEFDAKAFEIERPH